MSIRYHLGLATCSSLLVLATACGGGTNNSAPRFSTLPDQSVGGGSVFSLDLSSFVTDGEGQALTFSVVSGGGSFSGAVYSNSFATLGTYPVSVQAADPLGKSGTASFNVKVTSANLAAVIEGDNLMLLDTDTDAFLTVSGATGFNDVFKAGLTKGHVVYQRSAGTERLFVYDTASRTTTALGDTADHDTAYAAKTTDDRIVFTTTPSPTDTDLFIFDPATGQTRTISAATGEQDRNPFVSSTGLVFYERGSLGQADVYYYDPAQDLSFAVSTSPMGEAIKAVLPNDAVVFTRVGAGGEQDLFSFRIGAGLVEIGSDLGATVQGQTKTYRGVTSQSRVVFEVTAAASKDLYVWDPVTGASRVIAIGVTDETLAVVTPTDEIVYDVAASSSNNDLSIYNYTTNASRVISVSADNDVFQGTLSNGDVVFLRQTATGDDLFLFDTSASSTAAIVTAGPDNYTLQKILGNDFLVYAGSGATAGISLYDPSTTTVVQAFGATSVFGGETSGGDFAYQTSVSSQTDLSLWDQSALASVVISSVAGNDAFLTGVTNGKILFTRVPAGQTNTELFIWDAATTTATQLTTATSKNHSVASAFHADDS